MQTLTIPANVSKRKQACHNCRQRKKKCDAERPKCGLCRKIGRACEYSKSTDDIDTESNQGVTADSHTEMVRSGNQVSFPELETISTGSHSKGLFSSGYSSSQYSNVNSEGSPIGQHDSLADFELPSHDVLLELATLFFDNLYHIFPCFHKQHFFAQIEDRTLQKESPVLLFAMCSVAARYHPDALVKKRGREWYEQAKFYYDVTQRHPYPALRTIQAALLLIIHAFTAGDFSANWLFIGKTWRQAVAMGLNRIDFGDTSKHHSRNGTLRQRGDLYHDLEKTKGQSALELEEHRRTLWLMFIIDRNHSWPTGWPFAITEKNIKIDIPIADAVFQRMSTTTSPYNNVSFTTNMERLISDISKAKDPLNIFQYIIVAVVLLGRVSELVHSLHDSPGTLEFDEERNKLDSDLLKLRLSAPRLATSILEATPQDRQHAAWLQIIFNTIDMFLNYRQAANHDSSAMANQQLSLAVAAARRIAELVKDASRISVDILLSAHIASCLYIAAAILVIEWRLTGNLVLKQEVDLLRLVFDRMDDVFDFLGLKFRLALEHDMKRSPDAMRELREQGLRGLLADCSKWTFVREEVQRRGIPVEIS